MQNDFEKNTDTTKNLEDELNQVRALLMDVASANPEDSNAGEMIMSRIATIEKEHPELFQLFQDFVDQSQDK